MMAERVGFEPTRTFALTVFETVALDRSATSPLTYYIPLVKEMLPQ